MEGYTKSLFKRDLNKMKHRKLIPIIKKRLK